MKAVDKIPATENLFRMERCKRFLDKPYSKVELTLRLESEILLHKIMFQKSGSKTDISYKRYCDFRGTRAGAK